MDGEYSTDSHKGIPIGLPTRYRLGVVVGQGGSATVVRARDTQNGRNVVVKVLAASRVSDAQLDAEVRALARLADVPGVVDIEAVGRTASGVPWLVESEAPGGSLSMRIRSGLLPADFLVALAADLGSTLAAVHLLGVTHGDVTPGNVVLDADGKPLLCDFGVAALSGVPSSMAPLAVTWSFAAPERRAGGTATPASDVFGLASVIHLAATGELPRSSPSNCAEPGRSCSADSSGSEGEFVGLREVVPERLANVVIAGLADRPEARPPAEAFDISEVRRGYRSRWGLRRALR